MLTACCSLCERNLATNSESETLARGFLSRFSLHPGLWFGGGTITRILIQYNVRTYTNGYITRASLRPGRPAHGQFKLVKALARVELHPRRAPRLVVLPLVSLARPVVPRQVRRPRLDRRAELALPHQHAQVARKVARVVGPLGALQAPPPVAAPVGDPLACDRVVRRGGVLGEVPVLLQHPLDGPCARGEDADGLVAPRDLASESFPDAYIVRAELQLFVAAFFGAAPFAAVVRFWDMGLGLGKWWLLFLF